MARWRKLGMGIWSSSRFLSLSPLKPSGRALFLYLCLGPHTTPLPGIFRTGQAALAEDIGWSLPSFRRCFDEILRAEMAEADWAARVVVVWKMPQHNPPESINVVKSWATYWSEIPPCELKSRFYQHLKDFTEGLGEAFAQAFKEAIPEAKAEGKGYPGVGVGAGARAGEVGGARQAHPTQRCSSKNILTDEEWLEGIRKNPAYSHIDIDFELAKMDAKLSTPKFKGRKKTRQFIVNWLNRIDRPVETHRPKPKNQEAAREREQRQEMPDPEHVRQGIKNVMATLLGEGKKG